jgi:hypothetical protein
LVIGASVLVVVLPIVLVVASHESPSPASAPRAVVAASAPVIASPARVEVVLDVATAGLVESAQKRLALANLTFAGSVNDAPLGQYLTSRVLVLTKDPAAAELGRKVATVLGISLEAVFYTDQPTAVTDVVAILAKDYKP